MRRIGEVKASDITLIASFRESDWALIRPEETHYTEWFGVSINLRPHLNQERQPRRAPSRE